MKRIYIFLLVLFVAMELHAQDERQLQLGDTLIIEVGKSKLMLIVNDLDDLEKIRQYDLNQIIQRLRGEMDQDSTIVLSLEEIKDTDDKVAENDPEEDKTPDEVHEQEQSRFHHYHHVFNIELGMNNYLSDGKFPDQDNALYTVRPWGSWYVALASVSQFRFSRSFMIEGGVNLSWYNFKFQNDQVFLGNDDHGVTFTENPNSLDATYIKSKLTVAYLNASIVPVIKIGPGGSDRFRIGLGAYAGYRLGSYNKVKYEDDSKEKYKNHDPFHLNDLRYGVRFQVGFKDTDLFINYDLNTLFKEGQGPELNAFSFGVIL